MLPRELVPNLRGGLQLQLDLIYFVKLYENEDDEVEYAFRAGLRFIRVLLSNLQGIANENSRATLETPRAGLLHTISPSFVPPG